MDFAMAPLCNAVAAAFAATNTTTATFDVDERVAALGFSHVTSTRDRLALACVSRVWRKVAASKGAWGTCDVMIDGALGKKIKSARLERMFRYSGDVKHLEMCDAPRSFHGECLLKHSNQSLAKKLI